MNEECLKGKVALVTGAYQNLGCMVAHKLALEGADIIINDLGVEDLEPKGNQLIEKIKALGRQAAAMPADLSRSAEVRDLCGKALSLWGRVDVVVNVAGPFNIDPYLRLAERDWDLVMDVNVKAIYLIAQGLAPAMKKRGWGRIVNMSAGSAVVRNHGVYALAKAAVEIITQSLALELGPEVTVNAVAPGQILESLPYIERFDPTFGARYTARAPLKRLVSREEVAEVIARMCSPVFQSMTGVTLQLDGGAEIPRL